MVKGAVTSAPYMPKVEGPKRVEDIDLGDPELYVNGDPHRAWAMLREEDPVHWQEGVATGGFWAVTKYEDALRVWRDPEAFSNRDGIVLGESYGGGSRESGTPLVMSDPPHHTLMRKLVSRRFNPSGIRRLGVRIRELVREIFAEGLVGGEAFDLVEGIAEPYPSAVMCDILGVPQEDRGLMNEIANLSLGFRDPSFQVEGSGEKARERAGVLAYEYFSELVRARRRDARDDLISMLLEARVEGERLAEADVIAWCTLLVIAGNETTRNAIAGGVLTFCQFPTAMAELRRRPSEVRGAVEEVLRWVSNNLHVMRTATEEIELRGRQIEPGEHVAIWPPSVNRDEDVFERAMEFDVYRRRNPHMIFGSGPHYCLGAHLSRMEITIFLEEWLKRVRAVELAGEPERMRSNFVSALKKLPVTCEVDAGS